MIDRVKNMIDRHRAIDIFKRVPILYANLLSLPPDLWNLGPMGAVLSHFLRRVPNLVTMREVGKDRSPGVPKDNKKTIHMALMAIEWMRNKKIHFSANLVAGKLTTPHDMREKLISQASEYELKIDAHPENPFRQPKYTFAGASHDDLLISTMMIIFWYTWFWSSEWEGYANFKRRVISMRTATRTNTTTSTTKVFFNNAPLQQQQQQQAQSISVF